MKRMLILVMFGVLFAQAEAAWCKLCKANFMGRGAYCSRCKALPEIKAILKAESEEKKKEAERNKPLGIKSFLGYQFLSSGTPSTVVTQKLEKAFRGFSKVQLHYSDLGRLMKIQLSDSVPGRKSVEIEEELNALSAIFEKKYKFKFEHPISCNNGFYMAGGGWATPTSRTQVERRLIEFDHVTWSRSKLWKDFSLSLTGRRPKAEYSPTENTQVEIEFEMLGIREGDAKKRADSGANDLRGLDQL